MIELTASDTGLHLVGEPGAVLSGGAPLRDLKWHRPTDGRGCFWQKCNVWAATVDAAIAPDIPALFAYNGGEEAGHRRLTRARYPNGDLETDQWGYASPRQFDVALPGECRGCRPSAVQEWLTRPAGLPKPAFTYVNLTDPHNPSGAVKSDSGMERYNAYGSGSGGLCDTMWDTKAGGSGSYWCGNNTAGGWAEVDASMAKNGELLLPTGLVYNASTPGLERFKAWANASGAVVRAWHPQSWALHMFEVSSHEASSHTLRFGPRGGSQGGRLWCRCDQCDYVCAPERKKTPLLASGSWFVESVREELDHAGEWFFNRSARTLFLWPNGTEAGGPPPDEKTTLLVAARHATLIALSPGAENITIEGLTFRDAAPVFLEKWGVPSGGDWALHWGGAIMLEGTVGTRIHNCVFERLDGTAIFIGGRNVNARVTESEFAWLGDNAIALWGRSAEWDARGRDYPRNTTIEGNVFRELGIHEKQSSAVFIAKSFETRIRRNVMFNMPRAAININDGAMGGHDIAQNVIFHTCRESGDHGAINTWDRQPFLHTESGHASYTPWPIHIHDNLVAATYGASQGVDNDDGSSFYHTVSNVFYAADGFKMDYGGHDSTFRDNLVVVAPYDGQNCVNNLGSRDAFVNNTCLVTGSRQAGMEDKAGGYPCDGDRPIAAHDNRYYTIHGNASISCGRQLTSLAEMRSEHGLEMGSTAARLPADAQVVALAKRMVAQWLEGLASVS